MGRGSQSQASASGIQRTPSFGNAPPKGLRRRRTASTGGGNASEKILRFYTDDAPGLKISPTMVLIMSVAFIAFVTLLHIFGKFYGSSRA